MKDGFIGGFLLGVLLGCAIAGVTGAHATAWDFQNQAIERGLGEVVVVNGKRTFRWVVSEEGKVVAETKESP